MEKKLQDKAWASLPEDFRREVREKNKEYTQEMINSRDVVSLSSATGKCIACEELFGRHNLTAEEKPKFKIGDKVRMKMSAIEEERRKGGDWQEYVINKTLTVMLIKYLGHTGPIYLLVEENGFRYKPDWLEPYTEPTEKECGNLGEDSGNSHKPEDKDLNLCELLQGCEGMEFYSPYLGNCILDDLDWGDDDHCIRLKNKENGQWVAIPACGHEEGGELMLYPSKDVRTWDGWQKPKRTIKANEWVYYIKLREDDFYISTFVIPSAEVGRHYKLNEFSSRLQAMEAAKRIRETLEKYHDEIGE